tara:strand:- start:93 stop:1142 length:1050 start_codon:yes stop_codon:yes gene_type:complete
MLHYLKQKLVLFKQTSLWYYFIKFFFIPIFDFIWVNIINFQGRFLGILFQIKNKEFYKINKFEDFRSIENNSEFERIAQIVKNSINDELINKIKNKIKNEIELVKFDDPSKNQYGDYKKDFFPLLPDHVKKEVVNFALSEKNLLTATKYLKVLPRIKKIIVYLNVPCSDKEKGAQLWHKDDFGYKSLDIFLGISDIDISNGPLYFLKTKNPLGVFFKIKNIVKNALPGERNKVPLNTFSNYYKENEVGALIGKSGTGIFIDSFSKYHRGGFCKSKDRIMLRISYQTPDSERGNTANDSEKFFCYPRICKKDVKNIFHKYAMFKCSNLFMRFLKVDHAIIFLVRILHYKR